MADTVDTVGSRFNQIHFEQYSISLAAAVTGLPPGPVPSLKPLTVPMKKEMGDVALSGSIPYDV